VQEVLGDKEENYFDVMEADSCPLHPRLAPDMRLGSILGGLAPYHLGFRVDHKYSVACSLERDPKTLEDHYLELFEANGQNFTMQLPN